jgi:hypothetical protein
LIVWSRWFRGLFSASFRDVFFGRKPAVFTVPPAPVLNL